MRSLILLCSIALIASAAPSDTDRGAIAGTVLDPLGGVMAKANVQAKNVETGSVHKAASQSAGKYTLADLPAGTYDITVNVPGLRPFQQKGVHVQAAKTASFDIHLEEGTQLSTLGEDTLAIAADVKRHAPPAGPTPRTIDGQPDLSGTWWQPQVVEPGSPQWLPFAEKVAAQRRDNNRKDSPQARCLPPAVLRRGPLHALVQSKNLLVEISDDASPGFNLIFLNGRGHPKEPDTLWYGDSIGRWEGDTLVVDRTDFIEDVWLDQDGHPHGDKLHIIERYTRPDMGHLVAEVTVEDPVVLAKPWSFKRVSELAANEEIREFICTENNRDLEHMLGK